MAKRIMTLATAQSLAAELVELLKPACLRLEIVGSIRRCRPSVGDIELVAIPKRDTDLLGNPLPESELDELLRSLKPHRLAPGGAEGPRYKRLVVVAEQVQLDLFITDADGWGMCQLIRTGPAEFSKLAVTQRSKGGLLPDDCICRSNRIWRRGRAEGVNHHWEAGEPYHALDTPTEAAVFELLGLPYLHPHQRHGALKAGAGA